MSRYWNPILVLVQVQHQFQVPVPGPVYSGSCCFDLRWFLRFSDSFVVFVFALPPTSDDDIIFEDFARQRLIGAQDEKEEDEEPVDSPKLDDR